MASSGEGVADDLRSEWATSTPDVVTRSANSPAGVGPKAWRFEGEMYEIADTFAAASPALGERLLRCRPGGRDPSA